MGLYYGMGVDEVEINLDELHGLVTLAGSNGHGKSTFLELLSPYPVFPSRQMKDPRRYTFKNQFRLRDSYKKLTDIPAGEFKALLIELLGLKKYDEYHTNVGKCIVEIQKSIDEVERDLTRHGDHQSRIDNLNAQAEKFRTSLFMGNSRLEEAQVNINTFGLQDTSTTTQTTTQIAKTMETEALISEKTARREELESRLKTLLKEVADLKAKYEGWVNQPNENLKPHRVLIADSAPIKSSAAELKKAIAQEKKWNAQSRVLADMRRDFSVKVDVAREQIDGLENKIGLLLNDPEAARLRSESDLHQEKFS